MKLKPFEEQGAKDSAELITREMKSLFSSGKKSNQKIDIDEIRNIFTESGAGIEDVARMTGNIIKSSDKEELKIRAGELAMKIQGVYKEMDDKGAQGQTIIVNVVGEGNNTMVNLLCPQG